MKTISVRTIDIIADTQDLEIMCDETGNTFIQTYTKEKHTPELVYNLEIELIS